MVRLPSGDFVTSVQNLAKLIGEAKCDPSKFVDDQDLRSALDSQGALAKFSRPSKNIVALSLNTLKRRSDELLTYGFSGLDCDRRHAKDAIEREQTRAARAGRRTKEALIQEIRDLRLAVVESRRELANLSGAFYESIRYGRICAEQSLNPASTVQYEKHIRELLARFSLAAQTQSSEQ
jgi:hypothetical protein